ncbi:hypothetical protein LV457_13120 [Mycobacterium sp. MYCO198283]|uniref:hypothetical protein n=1 Tax=Mycobacterium sp. MYCO198283 TaxID=2883505 RepID=UPI001E57493D|nr:hypothetical protein [Mycobacterium sp. MYCO198283]
MKVFPDELTGTEHAVLLALMAECRPLSNAELAARGPELRKRERDRLQQQGLIETTGSRPMRHELTDDGWALCRRLFGADAPERVRGQGRVLYTVLKAFDRYFAAADIALADVFLPPEEPGDTVEDRIVGAYRRLARRPGDWVGLVRLRGELPDVPRADVDAALTALYRRRGVSIIPEENQKVLTDADRAAAVDIGNQRKHLIAIDA